MTPPSIHKAIDRPDHDPAAARHQRMRELVREQRSEEQRSRHRVRWAGIDTADEVEVDLATRTAPKTPRASSAHQTPTELA